MQPSGISIHKLGVNTLSLNDSNSSVGNLTISDGTTHITRWSDDHFTDTTVSGGVLNFNNQILI